MGGGQHSLVSLDAHNHINRLVHVRGRRSEGIGNGSLPPGVTDLRARLSHFTKICVRREHPSKFTQCTVLCYAHRCWRRTSRKSNFFRAETIHYSKHKDFSLRLRKRAK